MKEKKGLEFDIGLNPRQLRFDPQVVSARLVDCIYQQDILPYTAGYEDFRGKCLQQLRKYPAELVTELARIILFDYGLRLLSYELVFYHRNALPGETTPAANLASHF
jgi:hypothetical protein